MAEDHVIESIALLATTCSRGSAFLVGQDVVLTALHTVGRRSRRAEGEAPEVEFYEGPVTLKFPSGDTVAELIENAYDIELDYALLRCKNVPESARPLALHELNRSGDDCRIHGFPVIENSTSQEGLTFDGRVTNHAGRLRGVTVLQLFFDQAAAGDGAPVTGLSGAPCIVDGAVVGVIRASLTKERRAVAGTLFACPIVRVAERWHALLAKWPDPCIGLPGLPESQLPRSPFRYLDSYREEHAELFLGRCRQIRELIELVAARRPLLVVHGRTGVGKSSLLQAGLLPRVSSTHFTQYVARSQDLGLLGALSEALDHRDGAIRDAWFAIEAERPLVVAVDQVERAFTQPIEGDEIGDFLTELAGLLRDSRTHRSTVILAIRKEWLPDLLQRIERHRDLHADQVAIESLDHLGIMEAVAGLGASSRLHDAYGIEIDGELPGRIASDLLRDPDSPVAPMLQIVLTRLWEVVANRPRPRRFCMEDYESMARLGSGLGEFLTTQLEKVEAHCPADVRSGLALDVLYSHTTRTGTSAELGAELWADKYGERAERVRAELKNCYLLSEASAHPSGTTRLSHDTLAPHIRAAFNASVRPGQVSRRILESQVNSTVTKSNAQLAPLGSEALRRVEHGVAGMRSLEGRETEILARSRRARRHRRLGVLAAALIVGAATALWLSELNLRHYLHYRLLASAADRLERDHSAAFGKLGPPILDSRDEDTSYYYEVWVQRFDGGAILQLSQADTFDPDFVDWPFKQSTFVLRFDGTNGGIDPGSGDWFLNRKPPAANVNNAEVLALLADAAPGRSDLQWAASEPPPKRGSGDPGSYIGEGGKRVFREIGYIYAYFGLENSLGGPREKDDVLTVLFRAYQNGFLIMMLPQLEGSKDIKMRFSPSVALVLHTKGQVVRKDAQTEVENWGGIVREYGRWEVLDSQLSIAGERLIRPERGFTVDTPPNWFEGTEPTTMQSGISR